MQYAHTQIGTGVLLKHTKQILGKYKGYCKNCGKQGITIIQYAKKGKFEDKLYVRMQYKYIGLLLWFIDILLNFLIRTFEQITHYKMNYMYNKFTQSLASTRLTLNFTLSISIKSYPDYEC